MKVTIGLLLAWFLTACATPAPTVQRYDFGPPPQLGVQGLPAYSTQLPQRLAIADVAVPAWLDTPQLVYRLPQRVGAPEAYAHSRWVASPAALVSDRLRQRLTSLSVIAETASSGRSEVPVLRIDIEEFTHEFTSESASRGVLIGRAIFTEPGKPTRMTALNITRDAPSADAKGAAAALTAAAHEAIEQTLMWVASPR